MNEGAEESLALYERVFQDSSVVDVTRGRASGHENFMTGTVRIGDLNLIVFNGGPYADFRFNEAMSLFVTCADQNEVDRYWNGLSEGGEPGQCGWLKDRFGVSWQIVPRLFSELMSSSDPDRRERVFQAMMKMTKFDCAALQDAFDGKKS
ncbi:MAG TPA: VOC family protein [Acidimicrobiales bacterium]|nr:VOC family protein [Acidimicrobiales bacterium]